MPLLDHQKAYLELERPKVLPESPIAQAMACMLSNWRRSFAARRTAAWKSIIRTTSFSICRRGLL